VTRTTRAAIAWTAVAAVLLGLAWAVVAAGARRSVIVLDPLDEPVTVRFGPLEVKVAAGGQTTADVPTGAVEVEVRGAGGRVLDRHRLHVPVSGEGQAIYAVLGAAPLYRVNVVYTSEHAPRRPRNPGPSGMQLLVGERFQLVRADYVLRPPPDQIEMPTHSTQVVKTAVDLAPGGWRRALQLAPDTPGGLRTADALARRLHRALPGEWDPLGVALRTASILDGPEAAATLAEAALDRAPDSAALHRTYVHAARLAGHGEALRQRYRAMAATAPPSPLATAMLLRLLPRAEAEAAARAAVETFPADPEVRRAAAYVLLRTGHPADAAALYGTVALGEAAENGWVESQVRALLLAGRPQEAVRAALAAAKVEGADAITAALFARASGVAGGQPEVDPERFVREWAGKGGEVSIAWVQALRGQLEPEAVGRLELGPSRRAALAIAAFTTRDPAQAPERCRKAADGTLVALPHELALLLALEAHRTGDRDLYRRFAFRVPLADAQVAAWIDRGVEPEDAWRLGEDERAALALARARRLEAAGEPVPPALTTAARGDPLQGPAYWAALRWPRPARAAPPIQLVLQPGR
jgi:hypothetical protein